MIVFLTTTNNIVGLSLFIQNLIVAIKTGQISKKMAREIIKLLMRAGLNIDPELLDAAG
jgi:Asp-tRNA(Asn)/Glu-tRNA(Gln) amidotransferase B subunit